MSGPVIGETEIARATVESLLDVVAGLDDDLPRSLLHTKRGQDQRSTMPRTSLTILSPNPHLTFPGSEVVPELKKRKVRVEGSFKKESSILLGVA